MNVRLLNVRGSYICLLLCCTLAATLDIQGKHLKDNRHRTVKRSTGEEVRELDHLEHKRQQGWFSGFGKRSTDFLKRSQGFYSGFGKRQQLSEDGVGESKTIEPELIKKSQSWYSGFGKHVPGSLRLKRPQGWYSGFGKRTPGIDKRNQFLYSGFGKRSQGWFSGFGKRDPLPEEEKRHQGWHSGFGKRSQGWFSGFGKRDPLDEPNYIA